MKKYIPRDIEPKWQKKWKEDKMFSPNLDKTPKPYYALMMFPYPSAEGLHVGNMYPFSGTDIFARYKRMRGFDVLEPIGLDGFGIHSENYALKINAHPMDLSKITEKRFYEQLTMIGNAYDWIRTVETYKSNYYKWTQWIFLQMYKKGVAYRKKAEVNWCPSCLTVLADEQVINGMCERCGSKVEKRELEQWFFKITDYAERLLKNLDWIDWSEKVKIAQRNWIGKSEGTLIHFDSLEVFTTRPDTIFGATFMVISPEHPLLNKLTTAKQKEAVEKYVKLAKSKSEIERKESRHKTGVFTGAYVKNPATLEEIPVWVADYVLMGYGTGAIMGVPAHDQRDFDFAKKYGLKIIEVIKSKEKLASQLKQAYDGEGVLVNSGEFNGLNWLQAKKNITNYLEKHQLGKREIQYHLRDWLISRQRYWGPPIPIIYCDKCGILPVSEKDLPVELPYLKNFRPTGTGKAPLASDPDFVGAKCPKCGGNAKRETDVSDNFLDSAWYFFRYPSTEFDDRAFDKARTEKWLPVDIYIGGPEHAVLHLMYTRFITMVLKDLNLISFEEPFKKFVAHGLIIAEGAKMSKSKGNVVNPDKYIKEYGADTLRMYLMFMGPITEGGDFRDSAIGGIYRFLQRVWGLQEKVTDIASHPALDAGSIQIDSGSKAGMTVEDLRIMHKTIKKVGEDLEELKFNTAIAALMEWLNHLSRKEAVALEEYKTFLLLLAPFAPHITEELWGELGEGYSIHQQSWPNFDNDLFQEEEAAVAVQINGKVRDVILIQKDQFDHREVVEKIALEREKIQKFLNGKTVKKVVYVPGKVLNMVVG